MRRDELRQPLRKRGWGERLWARRPSALAVASVAILSAYAGAGAWLTRVPHPFAGEPIYTAAIPAAEELQTSSTEAAPEPLPEDPPPTEADNAIPAQPQQSYRTETAIFVSPKRPLKAAPIEMITETGPDGPLPKLGPGGKRAFELYSRSTPMGVIDSEAPKIAIVLGGMGLNAKLTAQAAKDLPGDITFAFAPYGEDLQAQVDRVRASGHEAMLQVPMEPIGYPASNPGPRTLLASGDAKANSDALLWHMSRFAGYTGITNYMGGKFLAEGNALKPILRILKDRGLVMLEDSSVSLTATGSIAKMESLKYKRADTIIDADPNPASIRAALELLEGQARTTGFAIGTGSGLQITIDTVRDWAKELGDRDILLVPVSAAYKGRRT
jgi:uncharacterized protein